MTKDEDVQLADVMVRDTSVVPRILRSGDGTLMSAALNNLYARLNVKNAIPLITSNRRQPKRIIDAKLGGPCLACGDQVWVSPSSLTTGLQTAVFCWLCVVKEAASVLTEFGVMSSLQLPPVSLKEVAAQPSTPVTRPEQP